MLGWKLISLAFLAAALCGFAAREAGRAAAPEPVEPRQPTAQADAKPYSGHPRLFFDGPADKNGLLKNLSPARAAIWKGVLKATSPKVEGKSGRQFGHNLAATALVYGISGDNA